MKNIVKSCISILLAIAIALSATSCGVKYITDSITEASETVRLENQYSLSNSNEGESDELSPTEKEEVLQNSQDAISDNVSLIESAVGDSEDDEYVEYSEYISDEEMEDFLLYIEEYHKQNVLGLATDCIAYDLYAAGYEVFLALAKVGNNTIPGIAFTNYEIIDSSDAMTVYSCGFFHLTTEESLDSEAVITPEDIEAGVIVVPYDESDTSECFIISIGASIPSYSGIFDSYYFRYDQIGDHAISISLKENERCLWDESIDLYNFDNERFVFKGDMSYTGTSATPFFSDEAKAYATAREAIEKIIEIQNSNAYKVESQVIIIFTEDALQEYMLNSQKGTINGFLIDEINKIKVESNQILLVTTEGILIQTVVDTEALVQERFTNGVIKLIASLLLAAGSIALTVATCGSSAPLAITAIAFVAGVSASVYNISNMIEGAIEVGLAAQGDIYTPGFNPVLECFKKHIPDEEKATAVYHAWGAGSSLIQSLILAPMCGAFNIARSVGVMTWPIGTIVRAIGVQIAKAGVTALVSGGIGHLTDAAVTKLTGNENNGNFAGFVVSTLVGVFTYRKLNKIDAKYNFSGLHNKEAFAKKYIQRLKSKEELRWDFPRGDGKTTLQKIQDTHGPDAPVNKSKPKQTFFNDDPETIIKDAWKWKSDNNTKIIPQGSEKTEYTVTMPYTIGTHGETEVTIIVLNETNQIITAFPSVSK